MKKILLLSALSLMAISCAEDSEAPVNNQNEVTIENKVMLLKVDLLTNTFEGGKELIFPESASFTIDSEYQAPDDFGGITLKYAEVNQPIFSGTIHWMGLGNQQFPEDIDSPAFFTTFNGAVEMPAINQFETVDYGENAYYPAVIDYQSIWNAIDNLVQVQAYRQSNPNAKVHLFLYTPSVGVGNPAEWDWYVILKD